MTTATSDTATTDADQYLREVAPHLAALPPEERADLLEDLAQHLREIAAEPGPPLAERLGSPAAYAAELLASAGVAATATGAGAGAGAPLLARATSMGRRARQSVLGREVVRLWPVLQPAWWVVRAYLAVSLLAATEHSGPSRDYLLPRLAGNPTIGVLAVLVAVPLSVRLGQGSLSRAGRTAVTAANVVLVIYALSLLGRSAGRGGQLEAFAAPVGPTAQECLVNGSGQPITNLYAYDADGRLLDPVLLYDQDGQPVDNVCAAVDERGQPLSSDYRQDVNGAPVPNAFPLHQSSEAVVPGGLKRPLPQLPGPATTVKPPAVVVPRLAPTPAPTAPPAGG